MSDQHNDNSSYYNNQHNQHSEDDQQSNQEDNDQNNIDQSELVPCQVCQRKFMSERIEKHITICLKRQEKEKKRKQKLAKVKKQPIKMEYIDQKEVQEKNKETMKPEIENPENMPAWKKKHLEFIEQVQYNNKIKQVQKEGGDINLIAAPKTYAQDDYDLCQYCQRKFAPHVFVKHSKICQNTINRPKPPKKKQTQQDISEADNLKDTKMLQSRKEDPLKISQNTRDSEHSASLLRKDNKSLTMKDSQVEKSEKGLASTLKQKLQKQISQAQTAGDQLTNSNDDQSSFNIRKVSASQHKKPPLNKKRDSSVFKEDSQQSPSQVSQSTKYSQKQLITTQESLQNTLKQGPAKNHLTNSDKTNKTGQNFVSCVDRANIYNTVQCNFCQRLFNPRAAERHIPICETLNKHKPLGLPLKQSLSTKQQQKVDSSPVIQLSQNLKVPVKHKAEVEKFCTQCGSEFGVGHKYCAGCGRKRDKI